MGTRLLTIRRYPLIYARIPDLDTGNLMTLESYYTWELPSVTDTIPLGYVYGQGAPVDSNVPHRTGVELRYQLASPLRVVAQIMRLHVITSECVTDLPAQGIVCHLTLLSVLHCPPTNEGTSAGVWVHLANTGATCHIVDDVANPIVSEFIDVSFVSTPTQPNFQEQSWFATEQTIAAQSFAKSIPLCDAQVNVATMILRHIQAGNRCGEMHIIDGGAGRFVSARTRRNQECQQGHISHPRRTTARVKEARQFCDGRVILGVACSLVAGDKFADVLGHGANSVRPAQHATQDHQRLLRGVLGRMAPSGSLVFMAQPLNVERQRVTTEGILVMDGTTLPPEHKEPGVTSVVLKGRGTNSAASCFDIRMDNAGQLRSFHPSFLRCSE